ncbi:hypothetical protein BDV96DRAFT_490438 [Lophiotrema nucula]|uniref:FAD/NAD(P)-binding domain-containing protein n=1 Tax=Lophiotrema nucula TaxID=690887 RepID=A0A6A5ZC73_9PLEO|nr:hypothetical protein BDV96DRAFT_490438 [Lophiotrema nucula]
MAHEIVVLGGNFAGLNLVHHLERQVLPVLSKLPKSPSYHLTIVSPNDHFFFKVGAPRALVKPGAFPEDKLFKSIAEALKQYGEAVTFVQGKATGLAPAAREVTIELSGGSTKELKYDSLFIATGTTSASALWTLHGSHKVSEEAFTQLHQLLPKTKSVLVAGAGPVGVETAGEITHNYPEAKVTLVGKILPQTKPATQTKALKFLQDAKVEVLPSLLVKDTTTSGSETTITLSDGSSKTVELFIDARGAQKINSDFLPQSWLGSTGRVATKDAYFRVKGDGQSDVSGIYVVGDIVEGSDNTAIQLDAQVPVATSSFAVDVASKLGQDTSSSGGLLSWIPGLGSKGVSQKEFKPMKDTILVPVGPTGGVGQAMGFQLPSFMVKKAKAEKFLDNLVEPNVTGSKYAKIA